MSTPIQRLNEAEGTEAGEIMMTLLAIREKNLIRSLNDRVQRRRHDYAKKLSVGELTHSEVVELIKAREDDFLEAYSDGIIPEPILRAEAQDLMMEIIYQKFVDEGLIKEDR